MAKKIVSPSRSPLAGVDAVSAENYRQKEKTGVGKIIIRAKPEDEASAGAAAAIADALNMPLPQTPNTTERRGDDTLLWLGPDEWMLWTPEKSRDKTLSELSALRAAAAGHHAAIVDVSAYYTIIQIGGVHADAALAAACPLDLRPGQFQTGDCAQSHYGYANILLHKTGDAPDYDLQVRWSFADYLWSYLKDSAEAC